MSKLISFRTALLLAVVVWFIGGPPASADVSHVRIIRVSLVQGDVRFAQEVKGETLSAEGPGWERAMLNQPIRQGYVLATDHGRAAVEFENGTMAFLDQNTILEFYDLSLDNGARTTRLILRQGSAEFSVAPERGEYFSVTGGDFSVQAEGRTTFRLNNFDDGSNVQVVQGRVAVLSKDKTTPVRKGQVLSMRAGQENSEQIAQLGGTDEFGQWAGEQIQNSERATAAAIPYAANSGGYLSGFGDLYTYGGWIPVAGYGGSCWRPYGVGLGWSPFDFGNWYFDPVLGWTFVGSQPWGWLPYHYGGWLSNASYGWCWSPGVYPGNFMRTRWRPVTAVWVHSTGLTGLVPMNPMDRKGKTPINLGRGIYPVRAGVVSNQVVDASGERWKVEQRPPERALDSRVQTAAAPAPTSRIMFAESTVAHNGGGVTARSRPDVLFDSGSHRFVSSSEIRMAEGRGASFGGVPEANRMRTSMQFAREGFRGAQVPNGTSFRAFRPTFAPPSVPRSTLMERSSMGAGRFGGEFQGGGISRGASEGSFSRGSVSMGSAPRSSSPAPATGRPH
jgi:Family of unknown function (DUF6600)/FecR protein